MNATGKPLRPYRIDFQPMNETVDCIEGDTLLDCARQNRIRIATACGGHGTCMSCSVQITDGIAPEPSPADREALSGRRLEEGWRRACQVRPIGNCTVYVPPRSTAAPVRTQVAGLDIETEFDPVVTTHEFKLKPPTIEDHGSDDVRLAQALGRKLDGAGPAFDLALLRTLAPNLRKWNWRGRVVLRFGEVIAVEPSGGRVLGLAVDLGTTNVSAFLVDLDDGATLASAGTENPQTSFGGDLIAYASLVRRQPEKAETLQALAADAINELAARLCAECGTDISEIVEITVAGNTMMHHLLLGLPVGQLSMSPFVPALCDPIDVKARDIGLNVAPGGYVHLLPNIAGFIGGDHVAALLATIDGGETMIIMDIGTNTEISLVEGDRITSVSCPSGPAFEGGHISSGMRAAVGAIEMVSLRNGELRIGTIEDAPAVGICGSGALDAVAQLYLAGITDRRGRLAADHPRVRNDGRKREFVLAAGGRTGDLEVTFTQNDVRAVQLAKAAIRSGIDTLLEATGRAESDLDRIIIAGAFGNYIDVGSALAIGMLPELPFSRFAQVGNAAGDGARMALLSERQRNMAADIARRCRYVELAGAGSFVSAFSNRINFPETRRIRVKEHVE